MEHIGTVIIYIIMVCAVLGAFGAIRNANEGIGKEFIPLDLSLLTQQVLWLLFHSYRSL